MTDPSKSVFLSYASEDTVTAQNLRNALRAAGIEVWFDQTELRGGDAWDASIRRQIKSCALFIPVISKNTHTRGEGYFRLEWKLAVDRSHLMAPDLPFLLPVVIDDTPGQEERVPDRFNEVHWTRLPIGANADAFVDHVRRLLSPDGVRPAATRVRSSAPLTASTRLMPPASRSFLPWIVGGLLIVATGYIGADKFLASKHAVPAAKAPATPIAPVEAVSDKSIAVLPFADMSEKHDQEYFSDGLAEELIDHLAHADDLKVIARTSSFQFKGKNEDMRTIGQRLGVANLLEGSVRTSGNTLRVAAQLINVLDGTHRWSQTYDRKMGDIFDIQDEIAAAVVAALKATMAVPNSKAPNPNIESYNKVLLGRYFNFRGTQPDSQRALAALEEAIKIDPENATAWVTLANTYYIRAIFNWMPSGEAYSPALKAVERALEIDPNLASAHRTLGLIEKLFNNNIGSYQRELRRSVELDPSLGKNPLDEGLAAFEAGRIEEAVQLFNRAAEVDPLDTWTLGWLAQGLYATNKLPGAERVMRELLDINSDYAGAHCLLGQIILSQHRPDAALETMGKEADESSRLTCMPAALWVLHRHTEADAMLAEAKSKYPDSSAYGLAYCYALRDDKDEAFRWLNRAYENHDLHLRFMNEDPDLRSLRADSRFAVLLGKLRGT